MLKRWRCAGAGWGRERPGRGWSVGLDGRSEVSCLRGSGGEGGLCGVEDKGGVESDVSVVGRRHGGSLGLHFKLLRRCPAGGLRPRGASSVVIDGVLSGSVAERLILRWRRSSCVGESRSAGVGILAAWGRSRLWWVWGSPTRHGRWFPGRVVRSLRPLGGPGESSVYRGRSAADTPIGAYS